MHLRLRLVNEYGRRDQLSVVNSKHKLQFRNTHVRGSGTGRGTWRASGARALRAGGLVSEAPRAIRLVGAGLVVCALAGRGISNIPKKWQSAYLWQVGLLRSPPYVPMMPCHAPPNTTTMISGWLALKSCPHRLPASEPRAIAIISFGPISFPFWRFDPRVMCLDIRPGTSPNALRLGRHFRTNSDAAMNPNHLLPALALVLALWWRFALRSIETKSQRKQRFLFAWHAIPYLYVRDVSWGFKNQIKVGQ